MAWRLVGGLGKGRMVVGGGCVKGRVRRAGGKEELDHVQTRPTPVGFGVQTRPGPKHPNNKEKKTNRPMQSSNQFIDRAPSNP